MEAHERDVPPGGMPRSALPRRVHFITDSDRGFTLEQIRTVRGGDIIYGELHERPTDEQPHRLLPGIAIMRSADELPTVGRPFNPEIVTDITRGTTVLRTGLVEIVSEDDTATREREWRRPSGGTRRRA
jgi:hypothetical protein